MEPVINIHKLLNKLKANHEAGKAKAMCEIFRNDGLAQFKLLEQRISDPRIRQPISDIVQFQTKFNKAGVCNLQSIQKLLQYVGGKVAEANQNKIQ